MERKSLAAAVAFALTGALLAGIWLALPDPAAWREADGRLVQEAYRLGPAVAAATFPDWKPADVPVLVTNGRANYLVNPWPGAPAGRPIHVEGLTVSRLDRLVVPVIANAAIPVNDRPVALITSEDVLEQALGGMITELDMVGGGETALIKGMLKAGSGRRITAEEYVSAILHESFHTYQLPVLQDWWDRLGDEGAQRDLWVTLYADAENSRLQNLEGRALLDAAQAADDGTAMAAAQAFLKARHERIGYWEAKLGREKAALLMEWERLYEWQEGLATYIQVASYRAAGLEYPVGQIAEPVELAAPRIRVALLGVGQALALDRLMPGWRPRAAGGEALSALLQEAAAR